MKKNTASLVLAIIGAVCGLIGAIMWAACADACADIVGSSTLYTVLFILLGIGGAVVSLIGGIKAFTFRGGRFALSLLGLLMQVANLIVQCVFVEGFSFVLSWWTLLAIVLLLVATILSRRTGE